MSREKLFALGSLAKTATPEPWSYADGCVRDSNGQIIACICEPSATPGFQQEADGEFIAEVRNNATQLILTISTQQGIIERLQARVLRLEAKLYGDK
jgi:hypothetical protein